MSSDITPADVEKLMDIFGRDSSMFQQSPPTKKKRKSGATSDRSSQLAKKKQEIKQLKQNLEIHKRDMERVQADCKIAVKRIDELEKGRDELLKHIETLDERIKELNSFGREDILDMD